MKIVVAGALAQRPGRAGHAWVFVNWLSGFRALGHDVLFVDRLAGSGAEIDVGARWLGDVMGWAGFDDDWSLLLPEGAAGRSERDVREHCRDAVVLNVMGYLDRVDLLEVASRRIFLDIDPGFGQAWHHAGLADIFAGHDVHATVGLNVGTPGCTVPDVGLPWIHTLPPVWLDRWSTALPPGDVFTTIATWRGPFAPVEVDGVTHGLRVHEARRYADLPHASGHRLEMALDIDGADLADRTLLLAGGWRLVDPRSVAGTVDSYREYIQGSCGELSVAKQVYVAMNTGWVSDRTACYLASGRAAIVSDTGLSGHLPIGDGLLTFTDAGEASDRLDDVTSRPAAHARAAADLASAVFDARLVAESLLERSAGRSAS